MLKHELSHSQKNNTVGFHLYKDPRAVRFREAERIVMIARGQGPGEGRGSNCSMGSNYSRVSVLRSLLEMDDGNGCTASVNVDH